MADHGINVQKFVVAHSASESEDLLKSFHAPEYVVKAQILAGGRGKGTFNNGFKGGVHLTKNSGEIAGLVENMIGNRLVTKQTSSEGVEVSTVMIAKALDITRETYLAILLDRAHNGPVIVGSPQGGMDIEEVAEKTPELIFKQPIDIFEGITDEQAKSMAQNLNFVGENIETAANQIKNLYNLFCKVDATQVEINPFGETPDGEVVCFDAKFNFDDNSEFRNKDLFAMGDDSETDPREVEASKYNLNYIGMSGNIGCLVNGAGLAMATMDIVKLNNGEPANFLDVGGGVNEKQVEKAFQILTSDPQVKAILVNIFGGIVNCATIATGVINASKATNISIPVVVRLEGTNVNEAKKLLKESGLAIITAEDLGDAAMKAVSNIK